MINDFILKDEVGSMHYAEMGVVVMIYGGNDISRDISCLRCSFCSCEGCWFSF